MSSYKKPVILIVGKDDNYRRNLKVWLRTFADSVFSRSPEKAENFFMIRAVNIFLVLDGCMKIAVELQRKFPEALICTLTKDSRVICIIKNIHCIQKPANKEVARKSIFNLWRLHNKEDERWTLIEKHLGLLVVKTEPQKDLEAFHFCLTRDPKVSFTGVSLRHEGHRQIANFCLTMQRGCEANCRFCATAKIPNRVKLTRHEIAAQMPYLLTSYKALNCLNGEEHIRIAYHGGGGPRYCFDELCGSIDVIENKYQLGAQYIVTDIGSKDIFPRLFDRLEDYNVWYEVSGNSAIKPIRDWLMPATANDSLPLIIEQLEKKEGSKYRHMLIKGLTDTEKHADAIESLLRGTSIIVIVTNMEPWSLPEFPGLLTEKDGERFVQLLKDRGINAYFIPSRGEGPVTCGKHISPLDRHLLERKAIQRI